MKVRIKVKHLFITISAILLLFPLISYIIIPHTKLYFAEQKLMKGSVEAKKDVLEILNDSVLSSQKWSIIKEHLIDGEIPLSYQFDVYVGSSFTQVNHDQNVAFTMEEKLPHLKEYIKNGPVDGYLTNVALELSAYYQQNGQLNLANQVIEKVIDRFEGNSQYSFEVGEMLIERAEIAIKDNRVVDAQNLIFQVIEEYSEVVRERAMLEKLGVLQAEILIHQGYLEEALVKIKQGLQKFESGIFKDLKYFNAIGIDQEVSQQQLKLLKKNLENQKAKQEGPNVKGKITRNDGLPLEGVGVFLRSEKNINQSIMESEPYQVKTDEVGQFTFEGVKAGHYQVVLGFQFEQIDGWTWPVQTYDWIVVEDEDVEYNVTLAPLMELYSPVNQQTISDEVVHFSWEEVEGADYYNIGLDVKIDNGSLGTTLKSHIKGTELNIPVDEIYNHKVGVIHGDEDFDGEFFDPKSILAFANPENRITWRVEAFNSEGKLLTKSNGYRLDEATVGNLPFFYLKERELTYADQLLLDKKVKEAYEEYKKNYLDNPNDVHSLRMMERLIGVEATEKGLDRDELALPYIEKLTYITGSPSYSFELARYYYNKQEWDSYNKWYTHYSNLVNDQVNEYVQGIHGSALMKQGLMDEARNYLRASVQRDPNHLFIGQWLAVEIFEGQSFSYVLDLAKRYPQYDIGHQGTPNWLNLVKALDTEAGEYENYHEEIQTVLSMYFQHEEIQLNRWMETTNMSVLKNFVKELKKLD